MDTKKAVKKVKIAGQCQDILDQLHKQWLENCKKMKPVAGSPPNVVHKVRIDIPNHNIPKGTADEKV